jgi:hypothetical protein
MAKCGFRGCTNPPVGGFEEVIEVGHMQAPDATIPGQWTAWCNDHREILEPKVASERGRRLTPRELRD